MEHQDIAAMLQQVSQGAADDCAAMLRDLARDPVGGDEDTLSQVMQVYQQSMDVFTPAELAYQSSVELLEHIEVGAVAASVNR